MVAKYFAEVVYYFYITSTFNYSFHSFYAVAPSWQEVKLGRVMFISLWLDLGLHKQDTIK